MNIENITQAATQAGGNAGNKNTNQENSSSFTEIFAAANNPKPQDAATLAKAKEAATKQATNDFLAYMKKSLAERMQEAWLKQHNMTREQFEALPPEEKKKVAEEMRADIEEKIKEMAKKKLSENTQFLASAI